MISDWFAIFPDLSVRPFCHPPAQIQFARNHRLRKITCADEIGHNVNLANSLGVKQKERVAQAWLLFPEGAFHIGKNLSAPNFRRMLERWRARVWIHRRAVTDDEECGVVESHRRKVQ